MSEKRSETQCPIPKGILVIVGGKEDKGKSNEEDEKGKNKETPHEILKNFIDLTNKPNPVIEVITTASSEGDETFQEYKELFNELGVSEVRHIHHDKREDALNNPMLERIDQADAFYISGGDQLKLTSVYGGTRFLTRLKERYIEDAIVLGGTSAGAMALSTPMIYAGNQEVQQITHEIKITTGLEFLKDVCIDTHFVTRGRFVRMAQVVVTNPTSIGIGIEEDTAIVVRNGMEAEVIGTGTIIIIDGFHITDSNITTAVDKEAISIQNMKVHFVSRGDRYKIPQVNPPHR